MEGRKSGGPRRLKEKEGMGREGTIRRYEESGRGEGGGSKR